MLLLHFIHSGLGCTACIYYTHHLVLIPGIYIQYRVIEVQAVCYSRCTSNTSIHDGADRASRLVPRGDPGVAVGTSGHLVRRRGGAPQPAQQRQHKGHQQGMRAHVPARAADRGHWVSTARRLGESVPDRLSVGDRMPLDLLHHRYCRPSVAGHAGLDDRGADVQQHDIVPAVIDCCTGRDGHSPCSDCDGRKYRCHGGAREVVLLGLRNRQQLFDLRRGPAADRHGTRARGQRAQGGRVR